MTWLPDPSVDGSPTQLIFAPTPVAGPSKVYLAFGSSSNHGDHLLNVWNPLIWAKTAARGASMAIDRST